MADDIKYLGFSDQVPSAGGGAVSTIRGVLAVDYTTMTSIGQLQTVDPNGSETYTDPRVGVHNGGFLITTGGDSGKNDITITYTGEQPDSAAITYVIGNAVYSGQNEPVLQLTPAVCFGAGTAIRTADGDVAVEDLRVGDAIVTSNGEHRAVRWLGHRTIKCAGHVGPSSVLPVRVAAHAFGEGKPSRDLRVSPGHSICLDVSGEILVPAASLINGTTVAQEEVDTVSYWHVELDRHDILFAENLPTESYLEMGNRGFFAEADLVDFAALPDAKVATHADFCRPFHAEGEPVRVARAQVRAQAERQGWRLLDQGLGDVHLVADGKRLDPQIKGLSARFAIPADVRELWLESSTSIPAGFCGTADLRELGVCLEAVSIADGFGAPSCVRADDPRLCVGFHDIERQENGCWRWTTGRARLPAALWSGVDTDFFLRLDFAMTLPRWVAPAAEEAFVMVASSA